MSSSRWIPQSPPQRRRSHMSRHTFLPPMMWRGSIAPDRHSVMATRGGDRGRSFFSDLTIGESRRPPDNRRTSMNVGYPRFPNPSEYPPPPGYPYYEWDEFYDPQPPAGPRHDHRPRPRRDSHVEREKAHEDDAANFGSACGKLFQQLEQAEQFYQNFQQEFDNEITSIKKYAGDGILRELWSRRIGVPSSRRDSIKSEEEVTEWEDQLRKPCQKFRIQATKLDMCLQKVATATIPIPKSRKDETSVDSAKLLQDKIETSGEGIRGLLAKVYRSRQYCSELVKELGQLKTLVDPQKSQGFDEQEDGTGSNDVEYGPVADTAPGNSAPSW
ncbi:hypothetical protein VE00_04944 [Pseudogymnoascus sp. WSF 3629]|nr:hypothetical protein VE00_04944 [Pseudogymnoascus sp. WSF 3629]